LGICEGIESISNSVVNVTVDVGLTQESMHDFGATHNNCIQNLIYWFFSILLQHWLERYYEWHITRNKLENLNYLMIY
jgi:hypothetical protein